MSAAFPRGRKGWLQVCIPRKHGWVQRSLSTPSVAFAKRVETAMAWLANEQQWDILEAIVRKRLTWDDVAALPNGGLAGLSEVRATLRDVRLAEHVDPWLAALLADGGKASTQGNYRRQLVAFTAAHPMASDLSARTVTAYLRGLDMTPGSRRKVLYAIRSFTRYLRSVGIVAGDPLADVAAPKKNPPRLVYRTAEEDARLCAAAETAELRCLFALIHGTGADVSSALAMRRRDVRLEAARCDIPGTKTAARHRHDIEIDAWAIPLLRPHLATLHPGARLFPGLTRSVAHKAHVAARTAAELPGYTLRDARHSVAIRMRRDRRPFEAIAQRLGNTVAQVLATYAKFAPGDSPETDHSTSSPADAGHPSIKRAATA